MPTARIVVIGDEILSGKFREENAAWLIGELRELGVSLQRVEVIPDDLDEIAATVGAAAARADHVFTSGGVGPTHDDLTIAGIARAFGVAVVRHPELERLLRAFYGPSLKERALRMADVPDGATLVEADHPSWPVTRFRNVYVLPGVPVIFQTKFRAIRERFRSGAFTVRRVFCDSDESSIAGVLDAVVAAHPGVGVGSYPRFDARDHRLIITFESKDPEAAARAAEDLTARLPPDVFLRME